MVPYLLKSFSSDENKLLNLIFSFDFPHKNTMLKQLETATIRRETNPYYYIIDHDVPSGTPVLPDYLNGVPIALQIQNEGKAPLCILYHVEQGLLKELEIFRADSGAFELCDIFHGTPIFEFEYDVDKISSILQNSSSQLMAFHITNTKRGVEARLKFQLNNGRSYTLICHQCEVVSLRNMICLVKKVRVENRGDMYLLHSEDGMLQISCKHIVQNSMYEI